MHPVCFLLVFAAIFSSCQRPGSATKSSDDDTTKVVVAGDTRPAPIDYQRSVLRINSTQQIWSAGQPWEKSSPSSRRALAAIVGPRQVLTTAEMVADATFIELETTDGTRFAAAKVVAVDYEANLALLTAEGTEGDALFEKSTALSLNGPVGIGQSMEIFQVEDSGVSLLTTGLLQSVDVNSPFLAGHNFLQYRVKASMQTAASSFSLPVLKGGKLVGLVISYNIKDQLSEVIPADIISEFLKRASKATYVGFPSLGAAVVRTEDPSFREWLKLPDDKGGLYVSRVRKKSSAEMAGLKQGDVILAFDGYEIDRRGYYQDKQYGSMLWGNLIRTREVGEKAKLAIFREGKQQELTVTLLRNEESTHLVPSYAFGHAPNYLVKGGFIFQELSRPLLEAFGENWETRAPLNLLDARENPEKFEGKTDRVVFISACIPTPATVGYEGLRNLIVRMVNGKKVRDMKSLIAAFESPVKGQHSIEFDEEKLTIYLDEAATSAVDKQLTKRGIPSLSHTE